MNIHYVINSLDGGGAALPLADIVAVLNAAGHPVRISGLRPKDRRACPGLDAAGIRYEILGPDGLGTLRVAARLWSRLRADRPDLLWTSLTRATVLGQLAGYALGVPVVSWLHNAFLTPRKTASLRRTRSLTLHWIADCEATADFAEAELGIARGNMSVWPLFVADPGWPAATAWNREGPFRIGSLGRLHRNKCYDVLIRAAVRIRELDPSLSDNLEFVIAGVGPEQRALEEMTRENGLTNVRFIGFTDDPQVFLAGLHGYVQPSHHEGLCIAAHEAMAAGLPVVATPVGELPRSLGSRGERGLLCGIGDASGLADALVGLVRAPEAAAQMGRRARDYVLGAYSAAAFQERGDAALDRIGDALAATGRRRPVPR